VLRTGEPKGEGMRWPFAKYGGHGKDESPERQERHNNREEARDVSREPGVNFFWIIESGEQDEHLCR